MCDRLTKEKIPALLDQFDALLCDCDGVLWRGDDPIPGVREAIDHLRKIGKRVIFVTNNSTKSREQYLCKLESAGLKATKDEVFSSSFAAAAYLQSIQFKKKVYIVGEQGIALELQAAGFSSSGAEADKVSCSIAEAAKIKIDPEIGAVVVGLDGNINYKKCATAQGCILDNPGCLFIATNADASLPHGRLLPGAGTMVLLTPPRLSRSLKLSKVAMIATCTGRKPIVLGKPEPLLLDIILKTYKLDKSRVLMVGDRLDSDILFAVKGGIRSLMVLSGVSTADEAETGQIKPTFITNSLADLGPGA